MNVLIIDDEGKVCDMVERLVKDYVKKSNLEDNINIISFESIPWLLTYIDNGNTADIIFMDIKLKDYNGIDLAQKIQEADKEAVIIFMTGYIEYAEEIFRAKPFYFLIKPVTAERVDNIMDRAIEHRRAALKSSFWFKVENVSYCVDKRDIYYIEADKKNVNIYTKDKNYKVNISFKNIEEETNDVMLKCHRSFMINPEKVRKCGRTEIELISGKVIPVSRANSREICEKICMTMTNR